jgi:hypothetical protein
MAKPKRPSSVSFPQLSLSKSSDGVVTSTENIVNHKVEIIGQDPDTWKGKVVSYIGGDDYKATVSYKRMARKKPRQKRKLSYGIEGISVTIANSVGASAPPNVATTSVIP